MSPVEQIAGMSESTFSEVMKASPRKVREMLFSRLGIKAKKKSVGIKVHEKQELRVRKLHERLKESKTDAETELCEELIRNWLFTKRPMLKSALDFLEVKNDDGLVEEETTFFEELEEEKVKALVAHLVDDGGYSPEEIGIYLRFVNVPHLDDALKAAA
jgi:hypothetical protein